MRAQTSLLHFHHIECKRQRGRQAGSFYSFSPGLGEYREAFSIEMSSFCMIDLGGWLPSMTEGGGPEEAKIV